MYVLARMLIKDELCWDSDSGCHRTSILNLCLLVQSQSGHFSKTKQMPPL
jgi:hypothetical protein